jgi:hypothetical protein
MTVTALIGALVALLPPGLLRPQTAPEIERLREEERRARELSNAHANLAIQKLVTQHWKDEARRLVNLHLVERDQWQRERQRLESERDHWQARAQGFPLGGQHAQAENYQRQYQYQALAQAQQNQQAQAQQLGMQLLQNAFQGPLGTFGELCNCVPGRHQVFEAERRRVTEV